MTEKAYSSYITENAIDAIGTLEGHWKGAERTADGLLTTYYGITKWSLGSMRQLKSKYKVDIPDELLGPDTSKMNDKEATAALEKKLKELTPEQARDITGYFAMYNTKQLDSVYGDNECKYISNLPIDVRSGILTLVHNEGERPYRLNYGKKEIKNSILKAAKSGDREEIVMALLSDKDGKLIKCPSESDNRGHCNRVLAAVRMIYDTENNSFQNRDTMSKLYDQWKKDKNIVNKLSSAALSVRMGNLAKEDDKDEMDYYCSMYRNGVNREMSPIPSPVKDPAAEMRLNTKSFISGVASGFTEGIKNLFTRNKEEPNVTGNENVNMQQGALANRRGTNQQPEGPIVESGENMQPTV